VFFLAYKLRLSSNNSTYERSRILGASCQQCGEHIEFPADGHGMRVQCPHCAAETVLIANPQQPEPQPAFQNAAAQEITAAELKDALSEIVPLNRIKPVADSHAQRRMFL
jgi:ribosomal protein S27E